jgi:hypothetical protein
MASRFPAAQRRIEVMPKKPPTTICPISRGAPPALHTLSVTATSAIRKP